LPVPSELTIEDENLLIDVRSKYNALTVEEKAEVTTDNLDKLIVLEEKMLEIKTDISNKALAASFDESVATIPGENELTLEDKSHVIEVRNLYEGLSDEVKVYITDSLTLLEALEAKILVLEEQEKNRQAQEIVDAIVALPELNAISFSNMNLVEDIINAYEELENDVKTRVDSSYLYTLLEYENRVFALMEVNNFSKALEELPLISELTLDDDASVTAIREMYKSFEQWQRDLISNDEVVLLEDYEIRILELIDIDIENRAVVALATLTEYLDSFIPDEITENVAFFSTYATNGINFSLYWSTGDSSINYLGEVVRPYSDRDVTINIRITRGNTSVTYSKNVIVKGIGEIEMPEFEEGKMLTFAYMRNKDGNADVLYARDYQKLDVINYAFAQIVSGKLSVSNLSNLNKVLTLRQKGVRVVLTLDGVSESTANKFAEIAASAASRKTFVDSVMEIVEEYQVDGLDLDWELNINATNYALLCKDLRAAFDAYHRKLILSAAFYSSSTHGCDMRVFDRYLDFLHIMTYGMGTRSSAVHETALYSGNYANYSVDRAVQMYVAEGFSRSKITFGIQFYVRMGDVSGYPANPLGMAMTNARSISYSTFLTSYYNANKQYEYFDPNTSSYYWFNGVTYASYDNPKSVKLKCEYAKNQNIAGVMYWDYGHDLTGTLLDSIYQEFKTN
ncbi:MAG: glycoside hydrolase family 18 protein, partial [Bacilli bacterium]|nr:glycoside hydrolase family 18 protein [Bacilli bacterium]